MITTTAIMSLAIIGIYFVVVWQFRSYRVDAFRQNMFALRDEWFDYAYSGGISFENEAYRGLRRMMNGYIRFAHLLGFGYAISTDLFVRSLSVDEECWLLENNPMRGLEQAISSLDDPAKEKVVECQGRMHKLALNHMVFSPLAIATIFPIVVFVITVYVPISLAQRAWSRLIRGIDTAALLQGEAHIAHRV